MLIFGGIYVWRNVSDQITDGSAAEVAEDFDGRAFVEEMPWKRLPNLPRFQLTHMSGRSFDSSELAGKPFVISFFFSSCPTICMDLNRQICRLANQYQDSDLNFVGLTVDSKADTPEVLREYMEQFDASDNNWMLLTGQHHRIKRIGEKHLSTIVDGTHHTSDIFLIDRWGRFRDRFTWDDPREIERFDVVARQVLEESEPPLELKIRTRNIIASLTHESRNKSSSPVPWLLDFQLTDQENRAFYSRDLTGQVWIGSFFFSRCGTVCPRQNRFLSGLQPGLEARHTALVSISTDPDHDQPAVLRPYARDMNAGDAWFFLTGDSDYIERIGSEFLGLVAHGEHHSSELAVVDKWGNVRARLRWQQEGATELLYALIEELNSETRPPAEFEVVKPESGQGDD